MEYWIQTPLPSIYIMIKAVRSPKGRDSAVGEIKTEYLIKSRTSDYYNQNSRVYDFNQGLINYQHVNKSENFQLSWIAPTLRTGENTKVNYHVLYTKNDGARLDSVCAIKKEVMKELLIQD
jgi:hypothetical protein